MALQYGNGILGDGSSKYALSGSGAGSTVTNNYSMSCWVYLNSFNASCTLVNNGANDARGMGLRASFSGNAWQCNLAFVATVNSGVAPALTTWTHIAVVRDSGTSQMYINGHAQGSTIANAPNSGGDFISVLGSANSSGVVSELVDGIIDDVRFYERALSAAEVLQLYNNGNVWPYTDISNTSLKYWYKLDETSGNPADSSGNGITLTNNGTATFVTGIVAIGSSDNTLYIQRGVKII